MSSSKSLLEEQSWATVITLIENNYGLLKSLLEDNYGVTIITLRAKLWAPKISL